MFFLQDAFFTTFEHQLLLNSSFLKLPANVQPPLFCLQSKFQAQNWQAELFLTCFAVLIQ